MTCIVGIIDKENNNVVIGGDRAASNVDQYETRITKTPKVFFNKDFLIGGTTSFRMLQLLQFNFNPPTVKGDLLRYMCTDFVDVLRDTFKKGGYLQKESKGDDLGGTFLVGYRNRLFVIEEDFQVGEYTDEYNAVGCGYQYALGSLYTDKEVKSKIKIRNALEAATYFSSYVSKPFDILNT